ncbi:PorV/PorQ family protein [candidate division KSB1 bacterium]|nr:PorV/PorQ family protein [candidate division KSB1 bacterium]
MRNIFQTIMISSLALLLLVSTNASGQRLGSNAADELLIPVGARYFAMGGGSIANAVGIESIYWNPAGLVKSEFTTTAMFSHMAYFIDSDVNYLAGATSFEGFGSIGLSMKILNLGEIPITTIDAPDGTGELFSPQYITAGLTYSRALTDKVAVGGTANFISESIDRVNASGLSFDFGVQYADLGNIQGLDLGVAIKNFGSGITFDGTGLQHSQASLDDVARTESQIALIAGTDELPSRFEIGLGYTKSIDEQSKVTLNGMFQNNDFADDLAILGAEYALNDMFFLRGGYGLSTEGSEDATGQSTNIFGLTAGAGLKYNVGGTTLIIDYAYRSTDFFNANNVFSFRFGL